MLSLGRSSLPNVNPVACLYENKTQKYKNFLVAPDQQLVTLMKTIKGNIPGGSKATMLAALGPQSIVLSGVVALTSHRMTQPDESQEATVSP